LEACTRTYAQDSDPRQKTHGGRTLAVDRGGGPKGRLLHCARQRRFIVSRRSKRKTDRLRPVCQRPAWQSDGKSYAAEEVAHLIGTGGVIRPWPS
jgi:hypothetical protein